MDDQHWLRRLTAGYTFLPLTIVFSHALGLDTPYRSLMYLNVAIVLLLAFRSKVLFDQASRPALAFMLAIPVLLSMLHVLAGGDTGTKEIRHLLTATVLAIGIWQFVSVPPADSESETRLLRLVLAAIVLYAAVQAASVFLLGLRNGTTKNPHYLAHYCLVLIPVCAYLFQRSTLRIRLSIGLVIFILFLLLIQSGSRPAWLSFAIVTVLSLAFRRRLLSWLTLSIFLAIAAIYMGNIKGFANRVDHLASTIQTEERVYMWRDTWNAQKESSPWQWIVGHNLDTFGDDFRRFTTYQQGHMDFKTPHNYILELLYKSGIIGLTAVGVLLFQLYRFGLILHRRSRASPFVLMLMATITANLLFVSITIGFFTSYNLLPMAIVAGLLLSKEKSMSAVPVAVGPAAKVHSS